MVVESLIQRGCLDTHRMGLGESPCSGRPGPALRREVHCPLQSSYLPWACVGGGCRWGAALTPGSRTLGRAGAAAWA